MEINAAVFVAARPQAAWSVLGERFSQVAEWAEPIVASSCSTAHAAPAVGVVRTCQIAGFGPIAAGAVQERLVAFDPSALSLEYEAVAGLPSFFGRAVNRWSVRPQGAGGCLVESRATLELRGPARLVGFLFAWKLRRDTRRVLDDLRHYVELGRPSQRKLAAMTHARERAALRPGATPLARE